MDSHFVGKFKIETETRRKSDRTFIQFRDTGLFVAPAYIPGVAGVHTLGIKYKPNAQFKIGDSFTGKVIVASPVQLLPYLKKGLKFNFFEGVGVHISCEIIEILEQSQ